ncbi:MAG: very short patch repair endonuclease [Pirellulaceae bacterium]
MSLVRAKDSKAELRIRRITHGMGFRYRLHNRLLPGSPDLVFARRRKIIFVHGCFWHQHRCAAGNRQPKSRLDFWIPKLEANKRRDRRNKQRLRRLGWQVLVIWECDATTMPAKELARLVRKFLTSK